MPPKSLVDPETPHEHDHGILLSIQLAALCEVGFGVPEIPGPLDLTKCVPTDRLICAVFPFGWLFEPRTDEPIYSQGGQIFVFSTRNDTASVPGVVLSRAEGQWRAWPDTVATPDIAEYSKCYAIDCDWISVLHEIGSREFSAVERLQETVDMQLTSFGSEILSRVNSFRRRSERALFKSVEVFLAWNIALLWDDWEMRSLPEGTRIERLREQTQIEVRSNEFSRLAPGAFNQVAGSFPSAVRSPASISHAKGLELAVERQHRLYPVAEVVDEHGMMNYVSHSPDGSDFFSFGGPPSLSFDFRATIKSQFLPKASTTDASILREQLWWWHWMPEWSEIASNVFADNFANSSFYYELQARLNPVRRWGIFEVPWVKLSNFQRGALNVLWPTSRVGRYTFMFDHGLNSFKADADHILIPIDLRVSQDDVISMVTEIHRRERNKRNMPDPGGRRKKAEGAAWEVIELLDREYYLGQQIKPSEQRLIDEVIRRYREDCMRAGLPNNIPL